MGRIKTIAEGILALDTRSLEFGVSIMNLVWGLWLLLATTQNASPSGTTVLVVLGRYGGSAGWSMLFLTLCLTGAMFAYRATIHHEIIFWEWRWAVLNISCIFWLGFSIFFFSLFGIFTIPGFTFCGVGLCALLASVLLRWDFGKRVPAGG